MKQLTNTDYRILLRLTRELIQAVLKNKCTDHELERLYQFLKNRKYV